MKVNNLIKRFFNINIFRGENCISYIEARNLMSTNYNAILLDVRSYQEYNEYHLDKAINIPLYELETNIKKVIQDKEQIIIIYCQSGVRSKKAVKILNKLSYINLYEIEGGIDNI